MSFNTETQIATVIENAQEVRDPFRVLVEDAHGDPGIAFEPENLQYLASLKTENIAKFETIRAQLKLAGVRVTILDEAIAKENGDPRGRGPSQADTLIELALDAELFHTSDGTAYADLKINGHRETWPIRGAGFKDWLIRKYYGETGRAPNSEAFQSARGAIQAMARFDGPEMQVHLRVGGHNGKLYLDLADDAWRAVEIDTAGWRIVDHSPVRFRRAAGMKALPVPISGGTVEMLRSFLNVSDDNDFVLVIAWLLAVLRDKGPYPVVVLAGEQGSAKSTFADILRALLDPNAAALRALPREDRDLFIAATNGYMLTFDNVSRLPAWISDTLCRLATGGGFAVRQLYTDQDEVLFDATRPVLLNGIEDIVSRPDLADRAIFLTLEPIPEESRQPEKELWSAFEKARPLILGALLDAVSHGLRRLPDTRLAKLPRMADFALWATACEEALWDAGTFRQAYAGNREDAVDSVIESDTVGSALRSLMASRTEWTGTATSLLEALAEEVTETVRRAKTWPATARALSGRVRRVATFLRNVGIDVSFDREGRARTRTIRISCIPETATVQPSSPSAPSADQGECAEDKVPDDQPRRTVAPPADTNDGSATQPTVCNNTHDSGFTDGADGADENKPSRSSGWRAQI